MLTDREKQMIEDAKLALVLLKEKVEIALAVKESAEAKLAGAVAIIRPASEESRKQLAIIEQEHFVFDNLEDRWQKLAFTLYSTLVGISGDAKKWLEENGYVES